MQKRAMERQVFNPELLKTAIFSDTFQISKMTFFQKGFAQSLIGWANSFIFVSVLRVCDALGWGKCTEGKSPMALNGKSACCAEA